MLRTWALGANSKWRRATAPLRVLPDFVIIGAQKSGTSSLYNYLAGHPHVLCPCVKEVHFFDTEEAYSQGLNWYRKHFPATLRRSALGFSSKARVLTGEASPEYLFHPVVPARAARALPHAKFIALLRNPVERAYSQYQMNLKFGREPLPFLEAVQAEESRIGEHRERLLSGQCQDSMEYRYYSYCSRGIYADQLERWLKHFGRDQLLVIPSEEFFTETAETYAAVLGFLGLADWQPPEFKVHWWGGDYAQMDPEARTELQRFFAPHNERLFDLIGRKFDW